jgi:cold shock protein
MNRECEFEGAFERSGDVSAVGGDRRNVESHGSAESAGDVARDGVVKWFRIDKGYGFVALDGGVGDAFLHLKSLRAVGRESAAPGAKVSVVVEQGARGMQVIRIVGIDETCSASATGSHGYRRFERDLSSAVHLTGTVKWFDDVRGFGFVAGDDFGRDVFVHCSVLGRSGVSRLDQGQAVSMRVIETPKGREAVRISL